MDLASAYVLRLLNCRVLDFEVHGRRQRNEQKSGERDGEDLESKRGQDLVANLDGNLVRSLVDI